MGVPRDVRWDDERTLQVGGTEFVASPQDRFEPTPERFCVVKNPALVREYVAMVEELAPEHILELGIFSGGSTALLAALAAPTTLVAIELSAQRVDALDGFVEAQGLGEQVFAHYGIDQLDRAGVSEVLDTRFGDTALDLVIDDASHEVAATRASFDLLFPRLRPGGWYIVEDWSWAHLGYGLHKPDDVPLTVVGFELMLALPSRPGLIADLRVTRDWVVVVRGDAPMPDGPFALSACYSDRGRDLFAPDVRPKAP